MERYAVFCDFPFPCQSSKYVARGNPASKDTSNTPDLLLPDEQLVQFTDSPFILGLGVPGTGLTVFSCDLEPTASVQKYYLSPRCSDTHSKA